MRQLITQFLAADNVTGERLRLARRIAAHNRKHPMGAVLLDAEEQRALAYALAMAE